MTAAANAADRRGFLRVVRAIRASLADQPERAAEFTRDLPEFATRSNRGAPDGPAEYHCEYLLVIARKRGG
jgi:hypothetical protein